MWQEENVWCFLGLNVAPARPHWRWFNIKAIKSQRLLSQYILSEFRLSWIPVNLISAFLQWPCFDIENPFQFFFQMHSYIRLHYKSCKTKTGNKRKPVVLLGQKSSSRGTSFHHSTLWPPNTFRSFYGAVSQAPRPHPCSLKPAQHCFSCVDENGPAENIQMSHPWFIVVPQYSWNCVISRGSNCLEVRVNRATSLFYCIVILVDSTFQYDDNKPVVVRVATAPPSSGEGNRSNPLKESGCCLKRVSPSKKSG